MRFAAVVLVVLSAACGSSSSSDGGDSSSSSSADPDTTTGPPPRCGGAPGNCAMYSPCEVCGDLASAFDENGCLRTPCTRDTDCGMGPRCFIGADFDMCISSMGTCADDPVSMTCQCEVHDDCGMGGWCVPEELYPPLAAGPAGVLVVAQTCGPDDGVLTSLRSYPVDTVVDCAAPPAGVDPQLELVFADPGLAGTYRFSAMASNGSGTFTDDDGDLQVRAATLTVTDLAAATTDGSYTYVVYDGGGLSLYGGFFTAVLSCPITTPCG